MLCSESLTLKRRLERISCWRLCSFNPIFCGLEQDQGTEGGIGGGMDRGESRAANGVCQYFPQNGLLTCSEETFKLTQVHRTFQYKLSYSEGRGAKFSFTPVLSQALYCVERKSSKSLPLKLTPGFRVSRNTFSLYHNIAYTQDS